MFKTLCGGLAKFDVQITCSVRSFDFALVEHAFVLSNGVYKAVVGNGGISRVRCRCIKSIEANSELAELHNCAVLAVHEEGRFNVGVHRDAVVFAYGSHGEDVGKGVLIIPDFANI